MIRLLKIILTSLTNLIHLLGFYITICIWTILLRVLGLGWGNESWHFVWNNVLPSTYGLLFMYGPIMISGFYTVLIALDIICFELLSMKVKEVLVAEWLLISIPFFYWAVERQYWLWIALSISFLGTQLIRKSTVSKVLNLTA